MDRAEWLELAALVREIEAAEFLELLGVENPLLNISEEIQDRARSRGMTPIHPARRTLTATGPRVIELFGPPGSYA